MIERILVAARGEVAVRIARTCKRLGVTTVGIFAEGEGDAPHVQACDEAVPLAAGPAAAMYADVAVLVDAARRAEAVAVIAGYGGLADETQLARAVVEAGMRWVGPSPAAIALAEDRVALRALAAEAEVRVPAGSGPITTLREAHAAADEIGYPLVVKPVRATPGNVLGEAEDDDELEEALTTGRGADGGAVVIERRIVRPRHVEVEVLGDLMGEVVVLGEREVSLRNDGERLFAESPAPAVTALVREDYVREALAEASQRIARLAKVVGSASVQFAIDPDGAHHFIGMRVGLVPEHSVHELCTGIDIVEMQLRLAIGEAMSEEALRATATGHAVVAFLRFEGRAEGTIAELRFPPGKFRIETGLAPGAVLVPEHDATLAVISAFAATRHQSVLALDRALAETVVAPQPTRAALLRRVLANEAVRAGQYDVTSVARLLSQRL